jgi:hypothetical protein
MAAEVSDRLRDALERLDQAIDRLDASVSARFAQTEFAPDASFGAESEKPKIDTATLAARLDTMIVRIETALADKKTLVD